MPEPTKIPRPFADSGDKNSIPDSSGGIGFASWQEGFPAITSEPFAQGGVAPKRADFNGIFNALSAATVWNQQGGVYAYDATTDYEVGNVVEYSGDLYKCITANGPSSAVKAPTDTTAWDAIATASGYLPLAGGTMTGAITFLPADSTYLIRRDDNNGILVIVGGSSGASTAGAKLYLRGSGYSTNPGGFTLQAGDSGGYKQLIGLPDGTLTWDGNNIACVSAVDATNSGYIRFTNGLQILWGNVYVNTTTGTLVTFEKPFSDIPRIFMNVAYATEYGHGYAPQAVSRSATGFTAYIGSSSGGTTPTFTTGNANYFAVGPWA